MKTKKELKEEYKKADFPMGVFQIKCTENGKALVDNSTDMASKWNRHRMELKFGGHRNKELQKDWNQYGEDKFEFQVLAELKKSEDEYVNYNKELRSLQEMILEEMESGGRY